MATETTQDGAGEVLWTPPADVRESTHIGRYLGWLERERGLSFDDYEALWRWSVDDLEAFWASVWDYYEVIAHAPYERVLGRSEMPGTEWFPGATLNFAEHALRGPDERTAIIGRSQTRGPVDLTYAELRDQVARARAGLQRLGVGRGDRVAAYMPNIPETIVVSLAVKSLGAIWSSCAPEFGTRSVVDRLQQVDPKVLLTVDGYRYGAKDIDRRDEVAAIRAALPSLEQVVVLPYLGDDPSVIPDSMSWDELLSETGPLEFEPVPFDHPLVILFSSGTTGLPKPIVHGHGGVLLEQLKAFGLHMDVGPEDRFFWFTTTGWVMWNILMSGLLVDATVICFDGNLAHPDLLELWRLAEETKATFFGVSAPYLLSCRKEGLTPGADLDLSALKSVGSTGAPLPPEGFRWVYEVLGDDVFLMSLSGGTDIAGGFVGASKLLPVWAGEIACCHLGVEAQAFDEQGLPVVDGLGELVVTKPMPSMPVGFWNDPDGERLRESYFDTYPGIWRHGDWIRFTERGSCLITGRSDATLNRGGVRLGTSEFYSTVEALDEIADSLVVHLEDDEGGAGELLLFVQTAEGVEFDDDLAKKIKTELRTSLSPRHIPDTLHAMPAVPRTLTGKKLEVPVKRILRGAAADEVSSKGALVDPDALKAYEELARERGA
jgi:acetoacetyl-CoA synthetase